MEDLDMQVLHANDYSNMFVGCASVNLISGDDNTDSDGERTPGLSVEYDGFDWDYDMRNAYSISLE